MNTTTTIKSWGSSLGVVIPKEIVKAEHLQVGEEVIIEVHKKHAIRDIFGSLKDCKIDSQKMKDDLRKEWR